MKHFVLIFCSLMLSLPALAEDKPDVNVAVGLFQLPSTLRTPESSETIVLVRGLPEPGALNQDDCEILFRAYNLMKRAEDLYSDDDQDVESTRSRFRARSELYVSNMLNLDCPQLAHVDLEFVNDGVPFVAGQVSTGAVLVNANDGEMR